MVCTSSVLGCYGSAHGHHYGYQGGHHHRDGRNTVILVEAAVGLIELIAKEAERSSSPASHYATTETSSWEPPPSSWSTSPSSPAPSPSLSVAAAPSDSATTQGMRRGTFDAGAARSALGEVDLGDCRAQGLPRG
jgi:hypothetical protein